MWWDIWSRLQLLNAATLLGKHKQTRQHINEWVWLCSSKIESLRGSKGQDGQCEVVSELGCRQLTVTAEGEDTACPWSNRFGVYWSISFKGMNIESWGCLRLGGSLYTGGFCHCYS